MAIYALSDLHLSFAKPKPMDVFGPAWVNHEDKIRRNWDDLVKSDDIMLLPGDLSWAMTIQEARKDLEFVMERPGRKVLIRGNHDYWWQRRATSRIQSRIDGDMTFLQGTSIVMDGVGITGTRGWRVEKWMVGDEQIKEELEHSEKVLKRELKYLESGLAAIPDSVDLKVAMLHFPPFDEKLQPNEFARLLKEYRVDIVVYGHVHLGVNWLGGVVDGIRYIIASCDIVDFTPQLVVP